jgi:U1 small nuclear ribonucleoprotein
MTSLLPPNLLRLFAPRPQLPYLKPLTKDEAVRGPDKLTGVAALAKRLREEAEDAEYKRGLQDDEAQAPAPAPASGPGPASAPNDAADKAKTKTKTKTKTNGVAAAGEADEEMGEVKEEKENGDKAEGVESKGEQKVKKRKMDKIAEMGIVGQEARKMRLELRAKRKEEYKKNLEKNCERLRVSSSRSHWESAEPSQTIHRTILKLLATHTRPSLSRDW